MNWKFFGVGLLILIAFKIVLIFYNPLNLGVIYNYILGCLTGFYFVAFLWELKDAGYIPIRRDVKDEGHAK